MIEENIASYNARLYETGVSYEKARKLVTPLNEEELKDIYKIK